MCTYVTVMVYYKHKRNQGGTHKMAKPKVRILADVNPESGEMLEEIIKQLGISKRQFFDDMIELAHEKYVVNKETYEKA